MARAARVVTVEHLGARRLRLTFSDGLVRELDLAPVLQGRGFAPLREETQFRQVSVDPIAGTICWPVGIDLDPDILHGDFEPASGRAPKVLREYQLRATG